MDQGVREPGGVEEVLTGKGRMDSDVLSTDDNCSWH